MTHRPSPQEHGGTAASPQAIAPPDHVLDPERATFLCYRCGQCWYVPPSICCPRCGKAVEAYVDPRIWEIGKVPDYEIYISGHMLNEQRTADIALSHKGAVILDLAHDKMGAIVWRKDGIEGHDAFLASYGLTWIPVWDLKDLTGGPLEHGPLLEAIGVIWRCVHWWDRPVIVHCAAGLRRAPHTVYAFLRREGLDHETAWASVKQARPLAWSDPAFIEGIEDALKLRPTP